ncbi:haloacid dehalogenase [Gemmobacter lanyuensis]|uniref:Haloacid dehalogenase n=1 Tax=Gemmobacter lanyuensis TaxID=1054497 RepID=A0A918MGT9_9RHOB|nr:HAD family hydrolase [Gemmobacter lanyuensis]GGW21317.1 haloacid dehalogenase [Gemmobacter lanyuensis]
MTQSFDLVIFDCDGVLIDSEIISARMLIRELDRLGVHIDLDYVARHFLGRSYPTVMQTIRTEFGLDLPPDFEDRYRARLLAAFETELQVMPGVRAALDGLALPRCVATSSSPKRAEMSLQLVGLGDLVGPRLFTASMVARGKPAPDLFLHAAAACGVAPDRCLVIEDSLTGIRAARAAGMAVWRFTGGSHMAGGWLPEPEDARPERHFHDFSSFLALHPDFRGRS